MATPAGAARRLAAAAGLSLLAPSAAAAQDACPRAVLPAYAHNDYRNARPLADALALGYRGVEADLFLVGGVLRVGHDRRAARTGAAFEALYLAPLAALAARCGPWGGDGGAFLLTAELKEPSPAAYDTLVAALGRHRPMLGGGAGRAAAVEVVLVGWHPPAAGGDGVALLGLQHRLRRPGAHAVAGLDARVRLLSLDYGKTVGRRWTTGAARRRWIATLRAAKAAAPGRRLRVHNVPPDAGVYAALLEAGVDLIGTKALARTHELLAGARVR